MKNFRASYIYIRTLELFQGPPDLALAAVAVDVHMHLYDLQTHDDNGLLSTSDVRVVNTNIIHQKFPSNNRQVIYIRANRNSKLTVMFPPWTDDK